jgi:P4 family phage/plasmid primase-like protien
VNIDFLEFNNTHPAQSKENRKGRAKPNPRWDSYGCSYSDDFLKFDVDDYDTDTGELSEPINGQSKSNVIVAMLDALGVKYNGIITEHGKHLFFRVPADIAKKTVRPWYSVVGVKCEWKFPASDDHIPLKVNGVERKFFKGSLDNDDVDELPFFLYPLQNYKHKPIDLNFPAGGRTQELGGYLFHLVSKGYTPEQAFEIVRLMNKYVFEKPIPQKTLDAEILNESTMNKLREGHKQKSDKSVSHSDVAKEIIDQFDLITVNGEFYTYKGGVYVQFPESKITNYLTKVRPNLNGNFEKEVVRHIKGLTYTEYPEDDGTVNVRNGIIKLSDDGTVTLSPHTKDYVSFKQFNAIYDPYAACPLFDEMLSKCFNNDAEQVELLNQVLAYLMMNHVRYQKIFFFVGRSGSGKSSLLDIIIRFCGKENISSVSLEDFNKPFGLAPIENKTVNIFGDIKKSKMLGSDMFKMVADGSPIQIRNLYKKAHNYSHKGKLIFGMNQYPDFSSDFAGIERRVKIFEFKHVFKQDDADFNDNIVNDLTTDEAMSAILNKAISGYKTLIANRGFGRTKASEKALNDFVNENNNVKRWAQEAGITEEYLLVAPIKNGYVGSYPEYCAWCANAGETAKTQNEFTKEFKETYELESYQRKVKGERFQAFKKAAPL